MSDFERLELYRNFEKAFNLDEEGVFDFEFSSVKYWNIVREYVEFKEGKSGRGLFGIYFNKLPKNIQKVLE